MLNKLRVSYKVGESARERLQSIVEKPGCRGSHTDR